MRKHANSKQYQIIGAYDSETTNVNDNGQVFAFPILHQLGFINKGTIADITSDNVENRVNIEMYRHALDLYARLDKLVNEYHGFVPVILCHNLSFDMYGLSSWLSRHDVRVLAKSARKPISFTIMDESGNPVLVIWDTLIFTQQSLERMGIDCGYAKGIGEWDYDKIRTPETPLSENEIDYAKRDIYTLIAWFGWWIARNPDIDNTRLGLNVVTKTGIVRERRRIRFDQLKGRGHKYNVGRYWLYRNRTEIPKSDDELFTMLAATRGGFTFCSSSNASVPFNLSDSDMVITAFDATSQHPAQLVSHRYPIQFKEQNPEILKLAFEVVQATTFDEVLRIWEQPFPVAFYGCFEFENLRPKAGTLFERDGILPLASARYKNPDQSQLYEDNGDKSAYDMYMYDRMYCDSAEGAIYAFGKIISADKASVYITELTAWEICQCYDFDNVRAIHGYMTGRFTKPSDMDVISVMQFYKAKDEYKKARKEFYSTGTISNGNVLIDLGVAPTIIHSMEDGTITNGDIEATYLSLKADLNSLFGIACSNEFRRDTVLTSNGIEYQGDFGLCNSPKNPKVWYQFGQRIVGWSRIAQICAMLLSAPHVETIVNGDTDSFKALCREDSVQEVENALQTLANSIDRAKYKVCSRIRFTYPEMYNELKGIGHYVHEFTTDRFCTSWNKAYCTQDLGKDGKRQFSFTLAGIPTRKRTNAVSSFIGINGYADRLFSLGWSFERICNLFLGYNVTFANDVIKLNARRFPEWGTCVFERVKDCNGNTYTVTEPAALAIYPMSKTINDTASKDNLENMGFAVINNPKVNTTRKLVNSKSIIDLSNSFID